MEEIEESVKVGLEVLKGLQYRNFKKTSEALKACAEHMKKLVRKRMLEEVKNMPKDLTFIEFTDDVKKYIKECEGKHIQQVAYSSYHDALTQVCFGCKKVRSELKELKNGRD